MAEIGATLREARMRQRIDVSEVEAATKIRAKYLRALENEEWDLLPGPAYVKTFLRAYADRLGLDGRMLVEQYKLRHERLSDVELQPIAPRPARSRATAPRRGIPRAWLVGAVFLALIGALYALGRSAEQEGGGEPAQQARSPSDGGDGPRGGQAGGEEREERRERPARRRSPARRVLRLQIVPEGTVYACVLDARGERVLVDTLGPGDATRTLRSRRFQVLLGNGSVRLRINGRLRDVPASADAIAYEITPGRGRRTIDAAGLGARCA
jgi:cytoskeleton protein RodZ